MLFSMKNNLENYLANNKFNKSKPSMDKYSDFKQHILTKTKRMKFMFIVTKATKISVQIINPQVNPYPTETKLHHTNPSLLKAFVPPYPISEKLQKAKEVTSKCPPLGQPNVQHERPSPIS